MIFKSVAGLEKSGIKIQTVYGLTHKRKPKKVDLTKAENRTVVIRDR